MNDNIKSAFICSQVAMMQAEMEMMKAANRERESQGYALAYGEKEWGDFVTRWENVLGYNAVIEFIRQ